MLTCAPGAFFAAVSRLKPCHSFTIDSRALAIGRHEGSAYRRLPFIAAVVITALPLQADMGGTTYFFIRIQLSLRKF